MIPQLLYAHWNHGGEPAVSAGDTMIFVQPTAPTGWTQDVSAIVSGRILRIVNGAGGGNGGTAYINSPANNLKLNSTTLTRYQMTKHRHSIKTAKTMQGTDTRQGNTAVTGSVKSAGAFMVTAGSGRAHGHGASITLGKLKYVDAIIARKD